MSPVEMKSIEAKVDGKKIGSMSYQVQPNGQLKVRGDILPEGIYAMNRFQLLRMVHNKLREKHNCRIDYIRR